MKTLAITLCFATAGLVACNRNAGTESESADAARPVASVGTAGAAERGASERRDPSLLESAAAKLTTREVTIPAGTELPVVLDTTIGSDTSRVEQTVRAHLSRDFTVGGEPVLRDGTTLEGVVTDATRSGKVKGLAHIAMRFNSLAPHGSDEQYRIETAAIGRTAPSTKRKDAVKIGAPAAGGAIVGAIVGGGKGAAIGAAAGGGAGTAVVMSTRGEEVHLPAGSALRIKLTKAVTIQVRG
jgi:hypothetical protein